MTVKLQDSFAVYNNQRKVPRKVEGRTEEKRLSDRKEFAVKEKLAKIREEIFETDRRLREPG